MSGALPKTVRRNDYSLDEQQDAVHEMFEDFFSAVSPSSSVRAAEPVGFDSRIWGKAKEIGVVSMAVPESRGGDGATIVDLVLMAEQYGRTLAPIPLIEAIVAARTLSGIDGAAADAALSEQIAGNTLITVALHPSDGARQLIPAGAIADAALVFRAGDLVLLEAPTGVEHVENLGGSPLAWWDVSTGGTVLALGDEAARVFDDAVRLWKLLTAAALVGSGHAAVALAVDFASSREAFGQFIGSFQAISHSLVDAASLCTGAGNLTRKAAWYAEHEPDVDRALIPMAYYSAVRAATTASTVGIHVQGGFGFTNESDMTLHFRRAKGWPIVAGRTSTELQAVAQSLPMPIGI